MISKTPDARLVHVTYAATLHQKLSNRWRTPGIGNTAEHIRLPVYCSEFIDGRKWDAVWVMIVPYNVSGCLGTLTDKAVPAHSLALSSSSRSQKNGSS